MGDVLWVALHTSCFAAMGLAVAEPPTAASVLASNCCWLTHAPLHSSPRPYAVLHPAPVPYPPLPPPDFYDWGKVPAPPPPRPRSTAPTCRVPDPVGPQIILPARLERVRLVPARLAPELVPGAVREARAAEQLAVQEAAAAQSAGEGCPCRLALNVLRRAGHQHA